MQDFPQIGQLAYCSIKTIYQLLGPRPACTGPTLVYHAMACKQPFGLYLLKCVQPPPRSLSGETSSPTPRCASGLPSCIRSIGLAALLGGGMSSMLDPALACLVALQSPSDSKGTRVPGISNNESLWVGAGYARNVQQARKDMNGQGMTEQQVHRVQGKVIVKID